MNEVCRQAFAYPTVRRARRHGPFGYADSLAFRPWLRDEFAFRCVYCLTRKSWSHDALQVDHAEPEARNPQLALVYTNLVYACSRCNGSKNDRAIADPLFALNSESVLLLESGFLKGLTFDAIEMIDTLALNRTCSMRFRRVWLAVIRMASERDPELLMQFLGYPDDLPNLSLLRPPGGNTRPEGIAESAYERRRAGTLPESY